KQDRQIVAAEPERGAIEILLARDLEADGRSMRLAGRSQHDRMMVSFLKPAQMERIRRLIARHEAEAIDIERPRSGKIAHAELDMAHPHDAERRFGMRRSADRHGRAYPGLRCVPSGLRKG